jgi:hypothetical protein
MSIDANFTQFHADIHGLRQSKKIHYAFYDVPFLTACALIRWGGKKFMISVRAFSLVPM